MIQKTKIEYARTWDWEHHPGTPLRWKKPVTVRLKGDPFEPLSHSYWLDRVFAVMALRPDVVFQVLTKRPERMREYLTSADRMYVLRSSIEEWLTEDDCRLRWPLPNVWLGTSVEDQQWADVRIPELLATPAAVRFVSAEPLLGPLDLRPWRLRLTCCGMDDGSVTRQAWAEANELRQSYIAVEGHERAAILDRSPDWGLQRRPDWVIVGGESGPGARPCDVAWVRSVVSQCRAAGVAVFVKQLGADVRSTNDAGFDGDTPTSWPAGTRHNVAAGYQGAPLRVYLKSRKGGDMAEWPEDLRVRGFPGGAR